MAASLSVFLLGRFEVARDDGIIPAASWRRRRPADLLKLLAVTPGRALSRAAVLDALWPAKDPASGANNLHRALYDLRQVLGGRFVDVDRRGVVRLRPDAWIDAETFERAVSLGDAPARREALSLYRGDLSPEDEESPWLLPHRRRLRARFLDAALATARDAAAAGDDGSAIPLLRRLAALDPHSEEPHLLLVRLLAQAGRRGEALREYDLCVEARRRAGLPPAPPELVALRDAVLAGTGLRRAPPGPLDDAHRAARRLLGTGPLAPLRGRDGVLAVLEALLDRGHGTLVLVGERGAGVTRLAVEGAILAQARGRAILAGTADVGPRPPGALLADLFAAEAAARPGASRDPFAATLPDPGAPPESARRRLVSGVIGAVAAAGRPALLVLDDLHSADATSLNLLHALAREAAGLRLVVLATCREDAIRAGSPVQTALAHLDTERLARGLHVPRLPLAGTRAQLADLLGEPPGEPFAAAVHRATDGRPACVEALLAGWRRTGRVADDPVAALRVSLAGLPTEAEPLLAAAAVLGRRFDPELARVAAGIELRAGLTALEAAVDAGLVDDAGDAWRFHCSLAHELVLGAIAPERRIRLHDALADALEARTTGGAPPAPEAVGHHRLHGAAPGSAVPHLLAAARRAAAGAGVAEASHLLERALDLDPRTGALSAAARLEATEALVGHRFTLGDLPSVLRLAEAAADLGPTGARGLAPRRWAALARAAGGDLPAALALLEGGGDPAPDDAWRGELRARLLRHARRRESAREAGGVRGPRGAGAGEAGRDAEAGAGVAPAAPGDPDGGALFFDLDLVLWERDLLCGWTVDELGAEAVGAASRAGGSDARLATARTAAGMAQLAAGRLDEAGATLTAAIEPHRTAGAALGEALALERLAAARLARGDLDPAVEALAAGVVAGEGGALRRHAMVRLHATLARAHLAAGDLHGAEAAAIEGAGEMAGHGECLVCEAALRPELLRIALALGRTEPAEEEVAALEALGVRCGGPLAGALAAIARGRLLAAQARPAEASVAFREARRLALRAGARLEAARAARLASLLPGGTTPEPALDRLLRCPADA